MPHLAPLAFALLALADPPANPAPPDVVAAIETALGDAIARAEPPPSFSTRPGTLGKNAGSTTPDVLL